MNKRQQAAHMQAAHVYAKLSYCTRLKVGCIVVSEDGRRVISIGYNGTPAGHDNVCEMECGHTKPEVIHAEANAFDKLKNNPELAKDSYVFCTHNPCVHCTSILISYGIKHFFYATQYRDLTTIELLESNGIKVTKLENYDVLD